MAGRRKKTSQKEVKLKFNHIYVIPNNKTLVIRKIFLEFEEIYSCDITEYDANGWSYKAYMNEPFTLKEICDMIGIDYETVIKP